MREQRIIDLLKEHRYLERSMIQERFFTFKTGERKSKAVLLRMYQRDMVSRFRCGRGEYIYHLGKKSQKWGHWLDLNRFHFSLLSDLKQWQKIIYFDFEVRYPYGQADALYVIKLTLDGVALSFFLEMDDGKNKFDKVKNYMNYKTSGMWKSEWWGQSFPLVAIVTPRTQEIRELVKRVKAEKFFRVIEKRREYKNIIKEVRG